jgi:DNA-binding CsgD family transcriptional regulator
MLTVAWVDQRKISILARTLYSADSIPDLSEKVVRGLQNVIGGNSILVTSVNSLTGKTSELANSMDLDLQKYWPAFSVYEHEHPGIKYHRAHPRGRAVTIGELLPMRQWRKTALFNEVCAPIGAQDQLGINSSLAPSQFLAVVINRSKRTFTERDRSVLDVLQLHIVEACRTLEIHSITPRFFLTEAVAAATGGTVIVLDAQRKVVFCSDLAQKHLETFFVREKPFHDGLPLTVERWARREITALRTSSLAVRPPESLSVRCGEWGLRIRLIRAGEEGMHLLLLRKEDPSAELAKLSPLGLGSRAAEVLYWLAKGKTNEEIGIILGMAVETVKTHLKRAFVKLNVENRTSAASVVCEQISHA